MSQATKAASRARAKALAAKRLSDQRRSEDNSKLQELRPHSRRVEELTELIADLELAKEELEVEGATLDEEQLAELEKHREELVTEQAAFDAALASLDTMEREKFLGILRFEKAKGRLHTMQDQTQPVVPVKSELQEAIHELLACVDHRLATQEDVADGDAKVLFCDCEKCSKISDGEWRTYEIAFTTKEGELRTRKASGSYYVLDGYDRKEKGSLRTAVYLALRARNRYGWAVRNAAPANAESVLERKLGRHFVPVEQDFPARENQPASTVKDHLTFDVDENGTAVLIEAGHRLANFFGNALLYQAWAGDESIGGEDADSGEKRLGYALLRSAGWLHDDKEGRHEGEGMRDRARPASRQKPISTVDPTTGVETTPGASGRMRRDKPNRSHDEATRPRGNRGGRSNDKKVAIDGSLETATDDA